MPELSATPTSIEATNRQVLHSPGIGERFVVDIALPSTASTTPLPVIYLTDGNMMFPLVTSTVRLLQLANELPPVILVGIGYEDRSRVMALRTRDLTPSDDPAYGVNGADALPAGIRPGGADKFLDFIENDVKPLVESICPVDTQDQTLAGDSLGGLFGLHALFSRPGTYQRYIIGSPSIWWNKRWIAEAQARYAAGHDDLDATVFMSVGSLEETEHGEGAEYRMVTNTHEVAETLRAHNYPSLRLTTHEFEEETHVSVIPATFSRGLREVFRQSPT